MSVILICSILQVMFYEILKDLTDYGMQKWIFDADYLISSSLEGLVLGGVAGGIKFGHLL